MIQPTILPRRILSAGCAYALVVFLFGFACGAFRVFLAAPLLGETLAVLLETPFMLLVCSGVSKRCILRFAVGDHLAARAAMGGVAFFVLMSAEFGVAGFIFDRSLPEQLSAYESIAGIIGLAGQVCFAILPMLQIPRSSGP